LFPENPSCVSAMLYSDPGQACISLPFTDIQIQSPERFELGDPDDLALFEAQSHGFNTLLSTLRAIVTFDYARLASGWLAVLCRTGLEPAGFC